jgi:hypothetical protein
MVSDELRISNSKLYSRMLSHAQCGMGKAEKPCQVRPVAGADARQRRPGRSAAG